MGQRSLRWRKKRVDTLSFLCHYKWVIKSIHEHHKLFWSIPDSIKDKFKLENGKTSLTINAYKEGGFWYFNLPPITWKECLVFTKALDEISGGKDKVKMTITTYEVEGVRRFGTSRTILCILKPV